ncbi:hypothetical protein [Glutamicibacter sp.]|uniref:hypothetical protein n=1 Tax=Glutamicibacter sp. TaxID=1931995 RepID=UPI0028BD71B9|nr:hypothetical protein [Glutamicibacter sp.]
MSAQSANHPSLRRGNGPLARIVLALLGGGALLVTLACVGVIVSSLAEDRAPYEATVTAESTDVDLGRCVKAREYTVDYMFEGREVTESFPLCATGGELQVGQHVQLWRGASGHLITTPPQSIAWMTAVFAVLSTALTFFCLRAAIRKNSP